MRNLRRLPGSQDSGNGTFQVRSPIDGATMSVIATNGFGWDHVSVSRTNRTPNWPEMTAVKALFFLPTETAMQLHVPDAEHVNCHPYCLHLWRPQEVEIPAPPSILVGPKDVEIPVEANR